MCEIPLLNNIQKCIEFVLVFMLRKMQMLHYLEMFIHVKMTSRKQGVDERVYFARKS